MGKLEKNIESFDASEVPTDLTRNRDRWKRIVLSCLVSGVLLCASPALANGPTGEKSVLRLFYESKELVESPSRVPEEARTAPATVELFTAEDLLNMGIRKLSDLLETLESVYISTQPSSLEYVWVRGVRERYNDKVLLLIDGVPRRDLVYEHAFIDEYLPLTNIDRIEIIRGPGSALYGTNAYAAVISIRTKKPPQKAEGRLTAGGGDYETSLASVEGGASKGDFGFYGYAHYYDTNGDGVDYTTHYDKQYLRRNPKRQQSAGLMITWRDFTFHADRIHYQHTFFNDWDVPTWRWKDENYRRDDTFVSAGYRHEFSNAAKIRFTTYYQDYNLFNYWRYFYWGKQGPNATPADVEYLIDATQNGNRAGGDLQVTFALGRKNSIVTGGSFEREKIATVRDLWLNPHTGEISLPFYIDPATIDTWALYLQDTWTPDDLVTLTAGVRADHHGLFGWKTSPRLGVSFHPGRKFVAKLLYGEAFRAPSARELFTVTGVFHSGNPNLEPESIKTVETDFEYTFSQHVQVHLNLYRERTYDDIYAVEDKPYMNHPGVEIKGLETGARFAWKNGVSAYVNYSYTEGSLVDVPRYLAHAGLNFPWKDKLNWNINAIFVGDRPRDPNDLFYYDTTRAPYHRGDPADYPIVNTTLRLLNVWRGMEVNASVYNLFDRNCFDPTWEPTKYYDIKRPNRTFLIRLAYRF